MVIHKPQKSKIEGVKINGIITEVEKGKWFIFDIVPKNRDFREELKEIRPRVQKIENEDYNFFRPPYTKNVPVNLLYLNWESAKGLYKNPCNNLPYEVVSKYGELIYRQSIIKRKEEILNGLEKLAIDEGLRK
jgi:hypothetical protein